MRSAIVVGFCLAALAVISAPAHERPSAGKVTNWRGTHPTPEIPQGARAQAILPPFEIVAAPLLFPRIAPYPSTDSDDVTGLSRNVDDCNKGCVDDTP